MIGFYTKFRTTKMDRDSLVEILLAAAKGIEVIRECSLYVVNKDIADQEIVWVTELWVNKEAHEASLQTEVAKHLISQAIPLLTQPPEQIKLISVGGKGV